MKLGCFGLAMEVKRDLVSTAQLKKKDVETKTSRRKRTWLDKKRKFVKKGSKKKEKDSKVCHNKKHI